MPIPPTFFWGISFAKLSLFIKRKETDAILFPFFSFAFLVGPWPKFWAQGPLQWLPCSIVSQDHSFQDLTSTCLSRPTFHPSLLLNSTPAESMVPDDMAWLHPPAFSACIVSSYLSWRTQFRFDFLFDIAHGYPFPSDCSLCTQHLYILLSQDLSFLEQWLPK